MSSSDGHFAANLAGEHRDNERVEFQKSRVKASLPERLVFFIDTHDEMNEQWNDNFESRMAAVKDAIGKFIRRKNNSPLRHLFALATYLSSEQVNLVVNYTTSEDSLTRGLDRISADRTSSSSNLNDSDGTKDHVVTVEQPVDFSVALGTLSDLLNLKSSMRILEDEKGSSSSEHSFSSPDYLTRCILVYGRSREVPIDCSLRYLQTKGVRDFTPAAPYNPLLHHPQCYLDILYIHLRANEEHARCQEVFDKLGHLARSTHPSNQIRVSNLEPFVLETHANAIKLGSHMAALMAHPAQREEASTLGSRMDMNSLLAESLRKLIQLDETAKKP